MLWHVDSNCGILVNTSLDHYHRNRSLLWFVLPWKPPSGPTTLNVIDLFSIKIPIFELSLHPMVLRLYQFSSLRAASGTDGAIKSEKFSEKFQTAFDPPPPPPNFLKIILQIFYDRYGCIYARRYNG